MEDNVTNEQDVKKEYIKRDHSVKVPKLYKIAAKCLQSVEKHEEGLKSAVAQARHPNKKAVTALVSTVFQNSEDLEYLVKKSKIMENEPMLARQETLVKILIAELLWGKQRLGGEAKPILTILKYREKFESIHNKLTRKPSRRDNDNTQQKQIIFKPRYVRVNTMKMTLDDAVSYLIEEGWNQKDTSDLDNLTMDDFIIDDFVSNLLVFAPKQTFHKHPLYLDGSFILQDKASCLAAVALKPRVGRSVMDACAAPGMKTTLLASLVGAETKLIAVEKSEKRCAILRKMLEQHNCDFVQVLNQDFTEINPLENEDVEYILVDPSCSGSGMYGRLDLPTTEEAQADRLQSLSYYQQKTLCHAMKFPKVKRIVYSTCSLNSAENEDVVHAALNFADNHTRFLLKKALPNWRHRLENRNYEWADLCAKFDYETDKTDGFFIAVLERKSKKK